MMATTTKPAAKKRAAKKPAAARTSTNEGGSGVTATQDPPVQAGDSSAETAVKKERAYRVTRQLTLDLTDPASIITQLQSVAQTSGDGDEMTYLPVVAFALVGTGNGANPKEGLTDLAQRHDLVGDYEAVAEGSIVKFPSVRAETKRVVTVG